MICIPEHSFFKNKDAVYMVPRSPTCIGSGHVHTSIHLHCVIPSLYHVLGQTAQEEAFTIRLPKFEARYYPVGQQALVIIKWLGTGVCGDTLQVTVVILVSCRWRESQHFKQRVVLLQSLIAACQIMHDMFTAPHALWMGL